MNKSHQQLKSFLADQTLSSQTITFIAQGGRLELINFKTTSESIDLQFSNTTFLKDVKMNSKIEVDEAVECCQLGSPRLEECRSSFPSMKITTSKGKSWLEIVDKVSNKEQLRDSTYDFTEELRKMTEGNGTVELIKVEWPHGPEIQVSYSSSHNGWIVSNGNQTTFCPVDSKNSQMTEENLKQLVHFWLQLTQECKNEELLKQILTRFTFCGKVSCDWKKVSWYSVIQTKSKDLICQDLFDAKTLVEKVGFNFARIKTVSMLNNEDQMVRTLQKLISTVQTSFCEARDNKYGRCKIYFISNSKKQVLGGFDISTLEDAIFDLMKELCCCEASEEQKSKLLSQSIQMLKNRGVKLPFPFKHYFKLFEKMSKLLSKCDISEKTIRECWLWLVKLTLYLEIKQISMEKYVHYFYNCSELKNYLSNVSFEELGPLNCSIITLYGFINPNVYLRQQLVESMESIFKDLELHFHEVKCQNNHEISINEIAKLIVQQSVNKLNHFFISSVPRLFQLKCLIKQLQLQNKEDCYYQLSIIVENEQDFVNVQENIYPFSYGSIVNAFQQSLNRQYHAKKLSEKAEEMRKVTDIIESLKNQEYKVDEKLIKIDFFKKSSERKEIKSAVDSILKETSSSYNPYYVLMIELGKREITQDYDMESIAELIISNTYSNLKSIL